MDSVLRLVGILSPKRRRTVGPVATTPAHQQHVFLPRSEPQDQRAQAALQARMNEMHITPKDTRFGPGSRKRGREEDGSEDGMDSEPGLKFRGASGTTDFKVTSYEEIDTEMDLHMEDINEEQIMEPESEDADDEELGVVEDNSDDEEEFEEEDEDGDEEEDEGSGSDQDESVDRDEVLGLLDEAGMELASEGGSVSPLDSASQISPGEASNRELDEGEDNEADDEEEADEEPEEPSLDEAQWAAEQELSAQRKVRDYLARQEELRSKQDEFEK